MADPLTDARQAAATLRDVLAQARAKANAKGEIPLAAGGKTLTLTATPEGVLSYEEATGEPLDAALDGLRRQSALAAVRVVEHFAGVPVEEARAAVVAAPREAINAAFAAVVTCQPTAWDDMVAALTADPDDGDSPNE